VLPGVSLNISKSGLSASFGPKGLKLTVGPKGIRKTAGIPGTGLYYTEHEKYQDTGQPQQSSGGLLKAFLYLILAVIVFFVMYHLLK